MLTPAFSILLPFLSLTAAEMVPAIRRDAPETHINKRQSDNPLLGKRGVCNQYYPDVCISSSGHMMCAALDEFCCFANTNSGVVSYVCPAGYPYCCPPQNGWPMCGTDISCGIGQFQAASSHPVYTDTEGPKPTGKSANMAPSAAPATTSNTAVNVPTNAATAKPAGSKPNAAGSLGGGGTDGGILAAVILGGLAVL